MRFPSNRSRSRQSRGKGGLLGGRFGIILIGLAGLFVYWQMNQKEVPFSGRKQHITVSVEQEMKLGAQSYVQILQQENQGLLCANGNCQSRQAQTVYDTVNTIGRDLEKAAIALEDELLAAGYNFEAVGRKFDWTFNVINSETPNAFCLPGGYVAIYTQIMDVAGNSDGKFEMSDLDDPNMLAIIMGHEIGHALAHHGAERMSQQKVMQMGSVAVGLGTGDLGATQRQAVMQAFGMAAKGTILSYSRSHESEADKIGLDLVVRACYDPRQAPLLWERMGALGGGKRPPEFMSTHPASATRAKNFREWMPQALEDYRRFCPHKPLR